MIGLFHLVWTIVGHPSVLIFVCILGIAAAATYFLKGPAALLKAALDPHTWIAVAVFMGALAFFDMKKENEDLKTQLSTLKVAAITKADAEAIVNQRVTDIQKRTAQNVTIKQVIANAPPDGKVDAALDAIQSFNSRPRA